MFDHAQKGRATVLDNGVRVLTDFAPGFETAATTIAFNVGSALETPQDNGISHLLEHSVFRGSAKRSSAEIRGRFSDVGGWVNATTDQDTTSYHALTLREHVGTAIETIADFVTNPTLRDEDIAQEKEIIAQENCRGCPNCSMRDAFYDTAFPEQGLSLPTIGTDESCERIDRAMLQAFKDKYYVGANLVVAVAGNVDHDQIADHAAEAFREMPAGMPVEWPDFTYHGGECAFGSSCDQGSIWYGFPTPQGWSRESYAARLFLDYLGYGPGSRLFEELREKRSLVYCVDSSTSFHARVPMAITSATGDSKKIAEIFSIVLDELNDAPEAMTEADMDRVKMSMSAGMRMGADAVTNRCHNMVFETFEYGHNVDPAQALDQLASVDLSLIRKVAEEMIAEAPTLAAYGPVRSLPRLPRSGEPERKRGWFG